MVHSTSTRPTGDAQDQQPGALQESEARAGPLTVRRWLAAHGLKLLGAPAMGLVLAYGFSFLIPPTYTAASTLLPPQQQQSAAASALASLGTLAGLAGGQGGLRSPADQYVALMQSATVSDRMIDRFGLLQAYDAKYRIDARKQLFRNARFSVGRKDGLITIEVDDTDAKRAADMANRYIEELRQITGTLAVSEAQQRRAFFEQQLQASRDKLTTAQVALQSSGFNQGALRAEPKAAAEGYARLKAELTASEIRLQVLRGSLSDTTPEVRQQQSVVQSLRAQLARTEQATPVGEGPDYVAKYREFKYQETLFDLFSRQYEIARVDESREGALIQVVDVAMPPEKASQPRRVRIALLGAAGALMLALIWIGLISPPTKR